MSTTVAAEMARNTSMTCSLADCGRPRWRLSGWCRAHNSSGRRLGHPNAPALRPRTFATQRKEVEALLSDNTDHPGLAQVLALLQQWMSDASRDPQAYRGAEELHRLALAGITPQRLLVEVLAFQVYLQDNPRTLPDDRAADVALSRAVFGLAPRPRVATKGPGISGTWGRSATSRDSYSRKARASALRHVGRHLRVTLSAFVANVLGAVEHRRALKADKDALQRIPLRVGNGGRAAPPPIRPAGAVAAAAAGHR